MGIAGYAEDKPIKKDLKITGIPKNINNPYMVIQFGGAMEACKEIGAEGKVVGPSETGASAQVPYINTAITQRQNAILVAANDPNALIPYLKKAMDQKIKVVTLDSDTAPGGRFLLTRQVPKALGKVWCRHLQRKSATVATSPFYRLPPMPPTRTPGLSTCRRNSRSLSTRT